MPKVVPESTLIGRQGVALVEMIVNQMKHVWNPTTVDSGIDGVIEFRDPDTGAMSNRIVQVQIKAGQSYFRSETDEQFTFYADKDDLEHWRGSNTPVILVVCRPGRDAYWADVKRDDSIDHSGKSPKLIFNKAASSFGPQSEPAIRTLANAKPWGFHLRPRVAAENLTLNFMPVKFPTKRIQIAETDVREPGELIDIVRASGGSRHALGEFVLHGGKIYAMTDLHADLFKKACDQGTIEGHDLETWIDERPSLGIELMNRMLSQIAWRRHAVWRSWEKLYFVEPTDDGQPRSYRVEGKRVSYPTVYQQYPSKKDPSKVAYHRHAAFEGQFQQFDSKWYLTVSPTYMFTSDGWRRHPYHEDYLKKLNEFEGPPAIFGHLKMWAFVLQPIHDFGADNYPHMELGPLHSFPFDRTIDDKVWKPDAPDENDDEDEKKSVQQTELEI